MSSLTEDYYSTEDINKLTDGICCRDLFAVHVNAVSLLKNFDNIAILIEKMKFPNIICVSETRLKDNKINAQLNFVTIPNYDLVYDNSATNAGGVAVYVKKTSLRYKVKAESKLTLAECESLFLELETVSESNNKTKPKSLILACVYRHPKQQSQNFVDELYKKLSIFADRNIPVVILGDINIDTCKTTNKATVEYNNTLLSIGCVNMIKQHTRVGANSRTTLDHVVTNIDPELIICGVLDEPFTDHMPIFSFAKKYF